MSAHMWLAVGLTLGAVGALMLFGLFVSYLWGLGGAVATVEGNRDEGLTAPPSLYNWETDL